MTKKELKLMAVLEEKLSKILGKDMFNKLFDNICDLDDKDYIKVLNYIRFSKNPILSVNLIISHAKQKTLDVYL